MTRSFDFFKRAFNNYLAWNMPLGYVKTVHRNLCVSDYVFNVIGEANIFPVFNRNF